MKRSELLWWAVGVLAALAAAAVGVWLYAVDPNVVTYHANVVLLAPLLGMVCIGLARVLPYRVQWALAIPLAHSAPPPTCCGRTSSGGTTARCSRCRW